MDDRDNPEEREADMYEDRSVPEQEITGQLRRTVHDLDPGATPDAVAPPRPEKRVRQEPGQREAREDPGRKIPPQNPVSSKRERPAPETTRNESTLSDADLKWLDDPQTLYLRRKLHVPDALSFVGSLAQVLSSSCVSDAMKKVKLMADLIASTEKAAYPVFAIDPDGKVIAWNKEMERITEVPGHEMIGRGDHAYAVPFYGKARPMLVDYLILPNPRTASGDPAEDVLSSKPEMIRVQGKLQLMWSRGTRVYDENGNIVAAVQSIGINDPVMPAKQPVREKARPVPAEQEPELQRHPAPAAREPEPEEIWFRSPAKAAERITGTNEDLRSAFGQRAKQDPPDDPAVPAPAQRAVWDHVPQATGPAQADVEGLLRNIRSILDDPPEPVAIPKKERRAPGRITIREEMPRENSTAISDTGQKIIAGAGSSDELFEQVVLNAREGIVAFDTGLNCILWNTYMVQLTGLPEREVLGRRAFDVLPALREAGTDQLLEQALSGKTVESSDISFHIPGSGKQAWVRLIISPIRDTGRGIIGIIAIVQDMTARKVMEFALQTTIMQLMESEEKYRSVFNAKNDPLILVDTASRRILDLNDAFADLYGYPRDELFRLSPANLFTEAEKFNDILSHKSSGICLCRQRKQDGSVFPADISYACFELRGRLVLILSIRDLSSAYQTADALRLANTKLNLLIGVTRHDVLNNLTVLMGYNDLLKHTVRDGKVLEMLEKEEIALKAVQRQIDFTREYYNLGVKSPLWQNICETSTRAYSQFITTIGFSCDTHDLEIYADPLLEKVFYNLFDNAIRHGERVTQIRIYCVREGSELLLIFGDDGRGIRSENKDRIFKRGFGKHTGLGLFLTREILAITRIDIAETGEFEKGARFELRIPSGMYRFPNTENPLKAAGSETMNLHAW